MERAVYDFHTHTFLSDGVLSPVELIRRAVVKGYRGMAIADHMGMSTMERVIQELQMDCQLAEENWGIKVIPGVELTHVPVKKIADCARRAKDLGARIVVVHGETVMEPVEPGTNKAAVQCRDVDILAHPGFLTLEEANMAKENGIYIEITARSGHSLTNGHVAQIGRKAGVKFLINSDGHAPSDLLTLEWAETVGRGAGLTLDELSEVLVHNPCELINRV